MQHELKPWPEGHEDNTDAVALSQLYGELQGIVTSFETDVSALESNFRMTQIQRDVEREHRQRDTLAEVDHIVCDLAKEKEQLAQRRRHLQRNELPTSEAAERYREARATLRSLTDAKRKTALQEGLERKDSLLLRAGLDGAAGYLIGMDQKAFDDFAAHAKKALHGDELAAVDQALGLADGLADEIERARDFVTDYHSDAEGLERAI